MTADRWQRIELRHLAALQAVAEEGSFHAAADRLGYTQSAVSQQIAALERIIGGTLIERPGGPRKVFLTDAGRLVLGHAKAIIARLQAAQADTEAVTAGRVGRLRVGTYQSTGEKILPALMPHFQATYPDVQVNLVESESDDELLRGVERGELDLTFALLPLPDGPFAHTELMRDPWVLLVPAGSPLATRSAVPLPEVMDLPLIGARLHRCRMHVDACFDTYGLQPHYVFRTDENHLVHSLVAAGMGVGILPQLAVDPRDERLAAVPLAPGLPPRIIALAWHRDRYQSPAATAFITTTRQLSTGPDLESAQQPRAETGGGSADGDARDQRSLRYAVRKDSP